MGSAIKFIPTAKLAIYLDMSGALPPTKGDWETVLQHTGIGSSLKFYGSKPGATKQTEYINGQTLTTEHPSRVLPPTSSPQTIDLTHTVTTLGFTKEDLETLDATQRVAILKIAVVHHYAIQYQSHLKTLRHEEDPGSEGNKIDAKLTALANILAACKPTDTRRNPSECYGAVREATRSSRPALEKSRDSIARQFLKMLLTVLSLGVAAGLGLWDRSGKNINETLKNLTREPKGPAAP